MTLPEPRGQEVVHKYKRNYSIPSSVEISEEMVLKHWELEKDLARQLLQSTPDNRWETFEQCYSRLYSELDWLNQPAEDSASAGETDRQYSIWRELVGKSTKRIYEIGSGKGELIAYLASCGHSCKGSEITLERGKIHAPSRSNLSWGNTDGIHLLRFESRATYDLVISNQVIEHMHPDDLVEHFKQAKAILVDGGKYIFTTPNKYAGPSDISRVFNCDKPMGMHLKEYSYYELNNILKKSGFSRVSSVLRVPNKINKYIKVPVSPIKSRVYFLYLKLFERIFLENISNKYRKKVSYISRILLFSPNIFLIAE